MNIIKKLKQFFCRHRNYFQTLSIVPAKRYCKNCGKSKVVNNVNETSDDKFIEIQKEKSPSFLTTGNLRID